MKKTNIAPEPHFTTRDAVNWCREKVPSLYPKVQKQIAEGRIIVVEPAGAQSCR